MPVTIKDIAKELGLSVSTVSKALNDYPDIAPETKRRVQELAQILDYYPSATARSLRRRHTNKIGLLLFLRVVGSSLTSEYEFELIRGVAFTAEKRGYNLVLYTTVTREADQLMRICRAREVDGLILIGAGHLEELIAFLSREAIPFVVLNRRVEQPDVSFIAPDNVNGARAAVCHLLELGHRRIGYIGRPDDPETNIDRLAGYRQALAEFGVPFDERLIIPASFESGSGYRAMKALLDLPSPPTAVFAFNDHLAIEALQAVKERGLQVPADVALVGFDDIHSSLVTTPPLTTVHQPLLEMGSQAAQVLLDRIADDSLPPIRLTLPVHLVVRGSTVRRT